MFRQNLIDDKTAEVRDAMREQQGAQYWEIIIADNLSKAGWSLGCVSAIDSNGRTIWIADAHRHNGKRFVVTTDEKLTAFLELSCLGAVSRHTRNWFGFQ